MPASQLYQLIIENPTFNVTKLKDNPIWGQIIRSPNEALKQVARVITPAGIGLRPEQTLPAIEHRSDFQQFQLDAAMWYGAIATGPCTDLLLKLFHIFFYAGVMYCTTRNCSSWEDWNSNGSGNVASVLSHGQRVLVQIPSIQKGGAALWTWLNEGTPIPQRGWATHGQSHITPRDLIRGHRQYIEEKGGGFLGIPRVKGWAQAASGHVLHRHYGFNVALGGVGRRNPFSAANNDSTASFVPIQADGLNGHVYINYMPPSNDSVGGMLVGCENAEPNRGKNPHTKAGHGLGGAQEVSVCGGKKWSKMACGPRSEYGGLICDLTGGHEDLDWLINKPLFDKDWLDQRTQQVPLRVGQIKFAVELLAPPHAA
jgi:hypothetical protein